jgi:hypothetical protein
MIYLRLPLYFVLALLFVGCAQTQPPAPAPEPVAAERPPMMIIRGVRPADPADDAFRDISRFHGFSEVMLLSELAQLDGSSETGPYINLRRLVLLWLLGKPENSARVDTLISQLMHHPDARISAMVSVLNKSIAAQRRSSERNAQLEAKLESKLAEAQRRIDQLTAKIQALKALEKELLSRPESKPELAPGNPPPR